MVGISKGRDRRTRRSQCSVGDTSLETRGAVLKLAAAIGTAVTAWGCGGEVAPVGGIPTPPAAPVSVSAAQPTVAQPTVAQPTVAQPAPAPAAGQPTEAVEAPIQTPSPAPEVGGPTTSPAAQAAHPVLGACDADYSPTKTPSQLLSRSQLAATLANVLDIPEIDPSALPADTSAGEFVTAESQVTSESYVQQLQASVEQLVLEATPAGQDVIRDCADTPAAEQAECASDWLNSVVRQAFRRPPSEEDLAAYSDFFETQIDNWGLEAAVSQVLQAVAADPKLLYRIEPTSSTPNANGLFQVDAHSMAERLSYFITDGPPDALLSEVADSGALLNEPGRLRSEAERLMTTGAGRKMLDTFLRRWLGVDLSNVSKSEDLRGNVGQNALTAAWDESLSAMIERVLGEGSGTIQELLTTEELELPEAIGDLYAEQGPRAGLLTHPAVLAQFAHEYSSPVLRGVFVRDHLLCSPLPPPPPGIDLEVPQNVQTNTTRERYALIDDQPTCGGCHQFIHSLGFAFEEYDALGRYRVEENGHPVDASGSFIGFSDPALSGEFRGVVELAQAIGQSEQLTSCVTKTLYESAIGRHLDPLDRCELRQLSQDFSNPSVMAGNLTDLVVSIVGNPRFGMASLGEAQ